MDDTAHGTSLLLLLLVSFLFLAGEQLRSSLPGRVKPLGKHLMLLFAGGSPKWNVQHVVLVLLKGIEAIIPHKIEAQRSSLTNYHS